MRAVLSLLVVASLHLAGAAFVFDCPGGQVFSVEYNRNLAIVRLRDGMPMTLMQDFSAPGERYSDGKTTFWNKGDEAMLDGPGMNLLGCKGTTVPAHLDPGSYTAGALRVDLFAGGTFASRGPADVPGVAFRADHGRWTVTAEGAWLKLWGAVGGPEEIPTTALKPVEGAKPLHDSYGMQGVFTYLADAATFRDCLTGKRYPVADGPAYLDLERAYLAARKTAGEPRLVSVTGSFQLRPAADGPGEAESLLVERAGMVFDRTACPGAPDAALEGTRWRLTEIGHREIVPGGAREVFLQLEDNRAPGFTGCHDVFASYAVDGSKLTLGRAGPAPIACVSPMPERDYLTALLRVASYRISGERLEWFDRDGALLARFTQAG